MNKIKVYQYQDTDITKSQTIATFADVIGLIVNAATNYVLVENLAIICRKGVDTIEIERDANQELVKILSDSFGINKGNMGKIYNVLVDESGCIVSSKARISEIKT